MTSHAGFASFPTEVLDGITEYLDGISAGRLWFIGNSALNYKLVHGGLTRLDVTLGVRRTSQVFPCLVGSFPMLRHLTLRSKYNTEDTELDLPVRRLPKSLETLRLEVRVALRSFATKPQGRFVYLDLKKLLPNLQHLSILKSISFYPELAEVLPPLRSLHLAPRSTIGNDFLCALPPSITDFRLVSGRKYIQPIFLAPAGVDIEVANFPFECLTQLHWTQDWAELPRLPSTLTDLSLPAASEPTSNSNSWLEEDRVWTSLPPGLKRLRFDLGSYVDGADYSPLISLLPKQLTSLSFTMVVWTTFQWSKDMLAALPRSLTFCDVPGTIQPAYFPVLPQDLLTLRYLHSPGLFGHHLKSLPPKLTELTVRSGVIDDHIISAPRRLLRLNVGQLLLEQVPNLPSSITALTLDQLLSPPHGTVLDSSATLGSEPLSLTHFKWLQELDVGVTSPFPLVQILPDSLRKLRLSVTKDSAKASDWSTYLPRTLSIFVIRCNYTVFTDEWQRQLPPQLKKLKLELRSLSSSPFHTETAPLPMSSFKYIPQELQVLSIAMPCGKPLGFSILDTLPPTLERFTLSTPSEILVPLLDRPMIDKLPKTLGYMKLPWSEDLDAKFTSFLAQRNVKVEWEVPRRRQRTIS